MEKRLGRIPVVLVTVAAAIVGAFLRHLQLQTMVDDTGKLMSDAGNGPLTWLSVAFAVAVVVYCVLLQARKRMPERHRRETVMTAMIVGIIAAFMLAMGSAAIWQNDRLLAVGGIVIAICWVVIALQLRQGIVPSPVCYIVAALFSAIELIIKFRGWSLDPLILDYCFDLFFNICAMCAIFHLGGFSFGKGRRKITVFFCVCGVFFGAVSLVGKSFAELLVTAGTTVWLLGTLWLMLAPEMAQPEAEEPAETEEA